MQALTREEAALPTISPIFIPVIAPWKAPAGPPTKNPPTPPIIPPATLPIRGPYFLTVLTKNPATFGTIFVATERIEPRNNSLEGRSNNFLPVSASRSNSMDLLFALIFNLAMVKLVNFTSIFFSPVESSSAFVKTYPNSVQNILSSIFFEFLAALGSSSAAFIVAQSRNWFSLTKKEVLPMGDILIVIPFSISML